MATEIRILLALSLLLARPALAQRYDLRTYSVGEGLAQSQVFAMLEDQRGYLWMGTRGGGLSRFDGQSFETYTTRQGLVNNYVLALHEGPEGRLWIGTDHGVSVYDGLNFQPLLFPDTARRAVAALAHQGQAVWLGTDQGLFRYQDSTLQAVSLPGEAPASVFALRAEGDTLWVGCASGLWQLTPQDTVAWGRRQGLGYGTVTCIRRDSHRRLWVGTYGGGLYQRSGDRFRAVWRGLLPGEGRVFDLWPSGPDELWVATQDAGAFRLHLRDSSLLRLDESSGLPTNHVHCLLGDRWGGLWLGTSGGGVSKYFGQQFVHQNQAEGLPARAVYAVMEDVDCRRWIGAGSQGVAWQTDRGWQLAADSSNFPRVKVKALWQDRAQRIWAGTEGEGLWWRSDSQWVPINGEGGLGGNWIRDLAEDQAGYLWVATAGGGLSRLRLRRDTTLDSLGGFAPEIRTYRQRQGLPQDRLTCLHLDQQDRLWYGSQDQGLGYLDAQRRPHNFTLPGPAGSNAIRCLAEDSQGYLWVGTANGVFRLDTYAQDPLANLLTYRQGLSSGNVYLLALDERQNLWIGTEQGVDRATLDPDRQIIDRKHFGYAEGFLGVETCQDAVYQDREGNLWFGTIDGLTQYTPGRSLRNPEPPVLSLQGISLFYTPLNQTDYAAWVGDWHRLRPGLTLPHHANHLSFDFAAVNLQNPAAVRYQWRLLGWEEAWSPVSAKSDATYSNLPPGKYTFMVNAANEDLVWNDEPLRISFEIQPPMWWEWWFVLGASLLGALLVFLIFQWRLDQVRRRAREAQTRLEMEMSLLEVEQKALRLQMNPHFIFNALSSIQGLIAEGEQQKARHQLARFARLMRRVLENSRESRITLSEEIQTLEDYLKLEQSNRGGRFSYLISRSETLEAEEILIPPMLLQPFIENAVIHGVGPLPATVEGRIELAFALRGEHLEVRIRDNGIGRAAAGQRPDATRDQRKSTALAVIQDRLALLHDAEKRVKPPQFIDLTDETGRAVGTEVRLSLPLELA